MLLVISSSTLDTLVAENRELRQMLLETHNRLMAAYNAEAFVQRENATLHQLDRVQPPPPPPPAPPVGPGEIITPGVHS